MPKKIKSSKKAKIRRKIKWAYIDKDLVHFLSRRRRKTLTACMKLLTRIGDGVVWFGVCVLFLAIDIYAGIALSLSSVIQIILQTIIKNIFSRQRPFVKYEEISNVMNPPDRYSFPSGHTAGAFTIAFVFYYFFPILFVPMLILASLIAFSRVYLGLHFPSDVIAGIILGLISARLGIYLTLLIEI